MAKIRYFADFFDEETKELFASYEFPTYSAAKELIEHAIKENSIRSSLPVKAVVNGRPTFIYVGMEGVTPYNTRIRMVNMNRQ